MAKISILDLQVSGSDLFADNESYLNELDDSSLITTQIQGGSGAFCVTLSVISVLAIYSYVKGRQEGAEQC
jgi:hypothetical protein